MKDKINFKSRLLRGVWNVRAWENEAHVLDGKDPIFEIIQPNGIVDTGIHYVLDRFTNVGTPAAKTWYAGLIDNSGFTGLSDSDTHATHSGWTESTAYSEGARQTLSFSAAATRSISDSVSFSINATVTIEGLFVSEVSTKGSTSASLLFSTAQFASAPSLVSGNTLTANYTLSD